MQGRQHPEGDREDRGGHEGNRVKMLLVAATAADAGCRRRFYGKARRCGAVLAVGSKDKECPEVKEW